MIASNLRAVVRATGRKWSFLPKDDRSKNAVIWNADDRSLSCKDSDILTNDPHKLVEGALLAGYAIGMLVTFMSVASTTGRTLAGCNR